MEPLSRLRVLVKHFLHNSTLYHLYRIFVDFIGHKDLGGKTILFLIDGLWSSTNYGDPPWKWRMAPFDNDYPSSIFASQDPVAIESVGFDFLYNEFDIGNPSGNDFPHYSAVDDFLHQAADSSNWPQDLTYDPEGDGTPLPGCMGVHEHWNNAVDKKYSRNLGQDKGIELVSNYNPTSVEEKNNSGSNPREFKLKQNYPNPFNPATVISYQLPVTSFFKLKVYDVSGNEVATLVNEEKPTGTYEVSWNADGVSAKGGYTSGVYFYQLKAGNYTSVKKMILMK